ncbi:hypothetical protein E3A20_05040, partial [Planctomyces bekefii]
MSKNFVFLLLGLCQITLVACGDKKKDDGPKATITPKLVKLPPQESSSGLTDVVHFTQEEAGTSTNCSDPDLYNEPDLYGGEYRIYANSQLSVESIKAPITEIGLKLDGDPSYSPLYTCNSTAAEDCYIELIDSKALDNLLLQSAHIVKSKSSLDTNGDGEIS